MYSSYLAKQSEEPPYWKTENGSHHRVVIKFDAPRKASREYGAFYGNAAQAGFEAFLSCADLLAPLASQIFISKCVMYYIITQRCTFTHQFLWVVF